MFPLISLKDDLSLPWYRHKTKISLELLLPMDFIATKKSSINHNIEDNSCILFAMYKAEIDLSKIGVPKNDG